nr:MAG TPA: replisome organizer [Bacteriophage sp.]
MAKRRMFSLDVVDTDTFLDLPASSQSLYFHLGMRADDDGFVSSPKRITAMVNASGDDLKLLMAKGFVIPFDSGVCVIRDWKVNNYIQSDRYTPTLYMEEKKHLSCKKSGQYDYSDTPCIQNVSSPDTQVRLGKDRKAKSKSVRADKPPRAARFTPPSVEEVRVYCAERKNSVDPERFVDFYASKGWLVGKSKMKDWRAAVRSWERSDSQQRAQDKDRIRSYDADESFV